MNTFFTGVLMLLAGGFFSLFIKEKYKLTFLSFLSLIGVSLILKTAINVLLFDEILSASYILSGPIGEVKFAIDSLSAFFLVVISVMGLLDIIYSIGYFKPYLGNNRNISSHCFFLSLLIVAKLVLVCVHNTLAFLIMWEIMSVSSFFLMVFENEKKETFEAGINYLITMHVGVIFLIIGFVSLANKTNSYDFFVYKEYFQNIKSFPNLLFYLFFIGFGLKAGFLPLHSWLPKAHPAAPSNISGIMSGVMIKTGIYGILRMIYIFGEPSLSASYFILIISLLSALIGVIYAIAQHDLKKLLAYHSVENIGIIGIGIGIGMLGCVYENHIMAVLGFSGAILHVLNHSIFKELLFYSAGSVYQQTHTVNIESLGGLVKKMPITAGSFLIGSIAISGIPPLNGFVSEFLIYIGMIESFKTESPLLFTIMIFSIASLSLVGAMALLCFTKAFGVVFLGSPRSDKTDKASESGKTMITSLILLSSFTFIIGVFPQLFINIIRKPAEIIIGNSGQNVSLSKYSELMQNISLSALFVIILFLIIFLVRAILLSRRIVEQYKTWDCGYQAGNTRMQYTASSYAKPFLLLSNFLIKHEEKLHKPENLFPKTASLHTESEDLFNAYIIVPATKIIKKFLDVFSWIQSGSTQQYILYGLLFLLGILVYVFISIK